MTQQEVIKAFMKSLDKTSKKGEAALNEAIKACAPFNGSPFNSFKELKAAMIRDCQNAKSADDFLKTYCGINLSNKDTGAITGSDAGGSKTKTAESIVPEEGSLVMFDSGRWFNVNNDSNNLLVQLGTRTGSLKDSSNNVKARSFDDLSDHEKYLWRSIYTWWVKEGLKLISESYGDNFSFTNKSATTKTMYVVFEDLGDNGTLAETWGGPSYNQKSTNDLKLCINMYYYKDAFGKNGEVQDEEHLDRTLAHELTHAVMRANIDYFDYLPSLIKEGMAELTHGIDDVRKSGVQKLAGNSKLLSKALVLDEDPVTISGSGVNNPSYAGGYTFLRYLARQAGDLTINNMTNDKTVKTFYGNDAIKNSGNKVTIDSSAGNDRISVTGNGSNVFVNSGTGADYVAVGSGSKKVTISSGTGNDYINNWGLQTSINTAEGYDTVYNSSLASNVYISTGAGNDSVENEGVKSKINGGAGSDTVTNYGASVSIDSGNDNDLLSNDHANKVTLIGGAGNDTLWNWSTNNTLATGASVSMSGGSGNDTIWNGGAKATISGDFGSDTVTNYGASVSIAGGDGNDSLVNYGDSVKIYGGTGNDSIWNGTNSNNVGGSKVTISGGKGNDFIVDWGASSSMVGGDDNDSIWGDKGNDIIKGDAGNDKIFGGTGNDKLYGGAGKDLIMGDTGNDTLWGGAGDDSLYGGDGKDTFIYNVGDGNDTIFDYTSGDMLKIVGGSFSKSKYSGGTLTLAISGGGKVVFDDVSKGDKFNINGKSYKISGSKLK